MTRPAPPWTLWRRPAPTLRGAWTKYADAAAVAARLAPQDAPGKPLDEEGRRRREAFLGRSLALLRRAAEQGVAAPPGLLDSDAFASLRDSPEFQRLRDQLTMRASALSLMDRGAAELARVPVGASLATSATPLSKIDRALG